MIEDLEADRGAAGRRHHAFREALKLPQVWLLTLIQFCVTSANPTFGFWGPTIIEGLGVRSSLAIGWLSAVPNVAAVICLISVARHSDRTLERRYHAAVLCLVSATGLTMIGLFTNHPAYAFLGLVLGTMGGVSASAPFWQFPPMLLAGTAAAGGIALINSIGSFSGWVAPFAIGWLKDMTGRTSTGLYVVAGLEVLAAVLILVFMPRQRRLTGTV